MITIESPLKGISTGTTATVLLRELPGLHTIDLRVTPGSSAATAATRALSMDLPQKPGQIQHSSISGGDYTYALCLAPDWWLIVGFPEGQERLTSLKDQFHYSAVDVSGQRTTIELEGPNAREVLAHLWEQDLREKNFPVGIVSQGLMAKAPVILCHMAPFRYRVLVRSSFALHVWQALVDAAKEWI